LDAIFNSALLVFISEMGDKTQLLSLILVARYKRPWIILLGVFLATLANHALAAGAGNCIASHLSPSTLKWSLGIIFFVFAIWILIPDKEGEVKNASAHGVLLTTFISFFIAEMGDKTQLATVALGAKYLSIFMVTIGSTIGMLLSNTLAIFLGEGLLKKIPMKFVRIFASVLFVIFGVGIIFGY
jgi:putative Ca2+/H+ antiporter (TMEM165/GDT1 family)